MTLVVLMFVVAVVFSLLGQGGGVLYTPIQVWFGVDFHEAATTSLFLIMVTSLSASLVFRRARRIDWTLVIVLEIFSATGGFMGGLWSTRFSGAALTLVFAAVVALAGMLMIWPLPTRGRASGKGWQLNWSRHVGEQTYDVSLLWALPMAFLAGLVSGLVGVGGGILKVPMMVLLLGIPMEIAVGCSALMIGLTAAAGFAGHCTSGHWDWQLSLTLAAVVFVGGQLGSRISVGLDEKRLKTTFGWFLLAVAALMLARLGWAQ